MAVKLYFGGGEVANYRKILEDFGNLPISLSYLGIQRSEKKIPDYHGSMLLDSGAFAFNKVDSTATYEDAYELAAEYMTFVKANVDMLDLVAEFDAKQLDLDTIKQFRTDFYDALPQDTFMPIWHPSHGRDELEELCSSYPIVGVSQEDIHGDDTNVPLFNQMIDRYAVYLHGAGITSKKLIESVKWHSVSSTAWLSTIKYGETFVWTGRELKRYPKSYKERARRTHRVLFTDNGFDAQKIEADDSEELLKLSIWSWQSYVNYLSGVTTQTAINPPENSERTLPIVGGQGRIERTTEPMTIRKTSAIPVIFQSVIRQENADGSITDSPVINVRSESMRVCDTCFIREKCPGYQPNSTCLYNIPIEVKTKEQLKTLQNALIEMQSQRVLFMKMAEDIGGGYSDPNLSSEMDRLQRMLKNVQEQDRERFAMSVTMDRPNTGPSFVQKFMGSVAASKMQEIEPVDADSIMEAEILGESS